MTKRYIQSFFGTKILVASQSEWVGVLRSASANPSTVSVMVLRVSKLTIPYALRND